jgi:DNA-binding PadR family transcriptional regulator
MFVDNFIYISAPTNTMQEDSSELTADDWILIFLLANQESKIHGKLMFAKELFIASNEIEQVSRNLKRVFRFYPGHYGPYSSAFENSLKKLEISGDISTREETVDNKTRIIFEITDKGVKRIKNTYEKLPETVRRRISKLKKGADQLGYIGVLKHVYTHYPEYAVKSRIKSEVYEF